MKKRFLPIILLMAAIMLCFSGMSAFAISGADCTLTGVVIDTQTYPIAAGATTLEIGSVFEENSRPRIVLQFSHNVQNEPVLEANLEKISLNKADAQGNFVKYEASTVGAVEGMNSGLFLRADADLEKGKYKIIVEAGVSYNNGSTQTEYTIFFDVGEPEQNVAPQPAGTAKISFDVSGITTGVKYVVSIQNASGELCPANADGTYYLSPGSYSYAVGAAGYITELGTILVSDTSDQVIRVSMKDTVKVTINPTPSDALIRLKKAQDQYIEPDTPGGNVFTVTPGLEYTYVLEKKGYILRSSRFTPIGDTTLNISMEVAPVTEGYWHQGNGGNTLLMLNPSDITEVDISNPAYYFNRINTTLPADEIFEFQFTMGAGVNSFNPTNFLTNNLPIINVYRCVGEKTKGAKVCGVEFIEFVPAVKGINMKTTKALGDGKYILSFGHNVCGNNLNKTIGREVMFEFSVGTGINPEGTNDVVISEIFQPTADGAKDEKLDNGMTKRTTTTILEYVENGVVKGVKTLTNIYIIDEYSKTIWSSSLEQSTVGEEVVEGIYTITRGSDMMFLDREKFIINTGIAAVTLTAEDVKALAPDDKDPKIRFSVTKQISSKDDNVKALLETGLPIYDMSISINNELLDDLNGISLPVTFKSFAEGKNLRAAQICDNHILTHYGAAFIDGYAPLTVDSLGIIYLTETAEAFPDIDYNYWSSQYVYNLRDWGIFNGYPDGTFLPQGNITRAEFIKSLAMIVKADVTGYTESSYADVNEGDWFLPFVAWAEKNNIIRNMGSENFSPNAVITRQDMAYWIHNYLKLTDVELVEADLSLFKDGVIISMYAQDAVKAAAGLGIINGFPDGRFAPFEGATREQAAKMLYVLFALLY